MKTTILSSSSRKDNNTIKVAKAIQNQLVDSTIIDFREYDFPNYNGDTAAFGESDFQVRLIDAIREADLLIVLTPEYNWFPGAEIVNTVHFLGTKKFANIFDNTTACFVGVSTGRGGRMPAVQLTYVFNKVFQYFKLNSITSPKVFESQETQRCVDNEGNLLDNEAYNNGLLDFIQYNVNVAKRWRQMD